MPLLCLSLTAPTLTGNLALARRYRPLVDLVELRVDLLAPSQWCGVTRFPEQCPLPVICTVRRERDGGRWPGGERARLRLLRAAAAGRFRWLDLEGDLPAAAVPIPRGGPQVIRSWHDSRATPANLTALLRWLARRPGEIAKLAVTPTGVADLARIVAAAGALRTSAPRTLRIVLGMGDYGTATRLLAARLGGWLTFTSATAGGERSAAPGQLDPDTMHTRYRFRELTAATPVFGIIGNPIAHSRSPEIHNRGLAAAGRDGVYVPFRVDAVPAFLRLAPALGVRGLSVTIPHKQAVIPLLARADRSVEAVGACNTLLRDGAGWAGYNTDAAGFLAPLEQPGTVRRATVIGAGGAARAIVWALRERGVEVLVINRSARRGRRLARAMGAAFVALDAADLAAQVAGYDQLIVQATSAGMAAEPGAPDPFAALPLSGREIVYDIVYTPPLTPLLQRARAAGCRTILGSAMLLGQAYEQFRLFTGSAFPAAARGELERSFVLEP